MPHEHATPGTVYIVGAGPGDPGLLTIKGLRYLQEADVVLYDDLLDRRLLDLTPPTCERIAVGKRGGRKSHSQDEIHTLLVDRAQNDQVVVRLKGGDPFVFGRGSEEALYLRAAGIPFEIVSGVSAAAGVPAYAGIPLTHRGMASAAVLVTGNEDPTKPDSAIDWGQLAVFDGTVVIFMGARKLATICEMLIEKGRAPDTPAAVVEWGTWPDQRTVVADLATLPTQAHECEIRSPSLIVVGEVVSLRQELNWFENKPLFGRRLLITRSRDQAGPLQHRLEAEGADVAVLPLLEIGPPDDWRAVDAAIDELQHHYAWIIFTSSNSVTFFCDRLYQRGLDARAFAHVQIAAVGLATASALRERGLVPDLVPELQSQAGLEQAFAHIDITDQQILFPASSIGRTQLVSALVARGAKVHHLTTYQNRPPAQIELPVALAENRLDLIVFASPSSVHNFHRALGQERSGEIFARTHIACIGPATATAVGELGFCVQIQPSESSIPALIQAIRAFYADA
jgi:uroporphyrinogen III methyltransferase/synthase